MRTVSPNLLPAKVTHYTVLCSALMNLSQITFCVTPRMQYANPTVWQLLVV